MDYNLQKVVSCDTHTTIEPYSVFFDFILNFLVVSDLVLEQTFKITKILDGLY